MANTNINNNDYVEFIIKTPFGPSRKVTKGPEGWDEEGLELDRHEKYHGIFTEFVESLTFFDEDADYLFNGFLLGGINVNCYLLKRVRRDVDGDVKMVDDYLGIADFIGYKLGENSITLNFNSHNLEAIIKNHEGDDFEVERATSIDDYPLSEAIINKIGIEGRSLFSSGSSKLKGDTPTNTGQYMRLEGLSYKTAITELTSDAVPRHASVDNQTLMTEQQFNQGEIYPGTLASNSFFSNTINHDGSTRLNVNYDLSFFHRGETSDAIKYSSVVVKFMVFNKNQTNSKFSLVEERVLYNKKTTYDPTFVDLNGSESFDLEYTQAVALVFFNDTIPISLFNRNRNIIMAISKQNIKVSSISWYESSPNLDFMFVSDVYSRLLEVLTGKKKRFYSKFFGKVEDGYDEDGDAGLVGLMSGMWVRAFDRSMEKYKSMTISLKDLFESTDAVFNLGGMIELNGFEERFRVEEKEFFYQSQVVVKLPYIVEEEEVLDSKIFFSSIEVGYERGGDYESAIGLDEPNVKNKYITPIRKSGTKYTKVSKISSDETGLELTRRKPAFSHPEEDTKRDDVNWFVDAKRTIGSGYTQKIWSDRLTEIPTGIHDPENFKSFFFTPFRMMKRHGSIITAGMIPYRDKFIKYISSKGNANLKTWFIGEDRAYSENEESFPVKELGSPIMTPQKVTFTHPLDDDLISLIKGNTNIFYKGGFEDLPNSFFKFEWKNTKGELRTGHMLNIKLKSEGEFTMQISNENII